MLLVGVNDQVGVRFPLLQQRQDAPQIVLGGELGRVVVAQRDAVIDKAALSRADDLPCRAHRRARTTSRCSQAGGLWSLRSSMWTAKPASSSFR